MAVDQTAEVEEELLFEHRQISPRLQPTQHLQATRRKFLVLSSASCLFFLLGLAIGLLYPTINLNLDHIYISSTHKPPSSSLFLQNLPITYHETTFNGSFLKENIYRQPPSTEVDEAWEGLGVNYNLILLPPQAAARAGLSTDQVRVREEYGGGYIVNLEGLHHLHCLNLLRQALHWNFPYYHARGKGAFENEEVILRKHVTHCLDILRQQLMCSVDVGVMGQVWIQPSPDRLPEAFVDFNTKHTCRNFEDVRQWAYEHQIEEPTPRDFLQPPREGSRVLTEIP